MFHVKQNPPYFSIVGIKYMFWIHIVNIFATLSLFFYILDDNNNFQAKKRFGAVLFQIFNAFWAIYY